MDPLAELSVRYRERGDVAALGTVFDRTAPRLLSLALHLCGDPADAEDALQDTFLIAMRDAAAFDRSRPLEPWLAGLLANQMRNQRRRRDRRKGDVLPELTAAGGDPVQSAERAELIARLRQHAEALPDEQRQVVLLQLEHGLTPVEIAEVLGTAPGPVRMRLHRGLRRLRRLLPATLATLLGTRLSARGLDAVRSAVLSVAQRETAATTGAMLTIAGLGGR